ncbi:hypothetical protein FOZ60_006672 [Perkinsus olseni]|uniref:Uncharacterized protein n=1 Tax=Perkinsus olseni TaxID=32597 RepID=A0A7J6NN50_PEROL|nr:hypothetical protein FOZ60_006672 [Perkinsus olseni]
MPSSFRNPSACRVSHWLYHGAFFVSTLQLVLSGNPVRKSADPPPTTTTPSVVPNHHTTAAATSVSPPAFPSVATSASPSATTPTISPSPTTSAAAPVTAAYSRPFEVTADYPPGCRGGPGPGKNGKSKIMVLPGSCVYIMKGRNSDGVQQESVGFKLGDNRPLSDGALEVQLNSVQGDPDEEPRVSADISGRVQVVFLRPDGTSLLWDLASELNERQKPGKGGKISLTSGVTATSPNILHVASTPFFPVAGDASSELLFFTSSGTAGDQSFMATPFISLKRKGEGWEYQVVLQVRALSNAYEDLFSQNVAITGVLYD